MLDYEWAAATSLAQVAISALFVVALLGVTVWGVVRRSPAAFASAWGFLILAPTSSVLPIVTEVAAEHRMYLPVAGIIALAVLGIFEGGRRVLANKSPGARRAAASAGIVAASAVVLLFTYMTYQRNFDYHDYDRIWSRTIADRPHNARARNNYATSLLVQGRFAEAEPHLRVAVAEKPSFAEAAANLGVALSAQGRLEEGASHLRRAVTLRPDYAAAHRNLAETYALQGRLGDAAAHYLEALDDQPDDVALLNRAAWILATARDPGARDGARARALAERAVQLTRRQDAESLDTLGAALAEAGDFASAAAAAREALGIATAKRDLGLSRELEHRIALYERGQKFRE